MGGQHEFLAVLDLARAIGECVERFTTGKADRSYAFLEYGFLRKGPPDWVGCDHQHVACGAIQSMGRWFLLELLALF